MTPRPHARHGLRLAELWALRDAADLTPPEQAELDRLEREESIRTEADRLTRALELAMIADAIPLRDAPAPADQPGVPARLMETLRRDALATRPAATPFEDRAGRQAVAPLSRIGAAGVAGWLAAAAAIALAVLAWWPGAGPPGATADPVAAAVAQIDAAPDAIRLPFKPADDGLAAARAEIVWSDAQQRGYLRLSGITPNDPATRQFQLWIVDPARDQRPVDGGVFDIASTGEVIIPVSSRLPVRNPAAFAITAERPGGVVVSDGPMLLVASRS